MTTFSVPLTESHEPATFKGRGITTPLTTPLLSGARARQAEAGSLELIVPNPSGGKGVYILQREGVRRFCSPTVHDTLLLQLLSRLVSLDPGAVRAAALTVATEGHAGHEASIAARLVIAADRRQRPLANFALLRRLVEQLEPNSTHTVTTRTAEFDQRANAVLRRLAPMLGRPASQLSSAVAAISDAFAPVGIEAHDKAARIPRLIERLDATRTDLNTWLEADAAHDPSGLGSVLTDALRMAAKWGEAVVASTRDTLSDPLALLTRRIADPLGVVAVAQRSDWLLDGWERVCLLWRAATCVASRRAALLEMAQAIPVLPPEAFAWTDPIVALQEPDQSCRVIGGDRIWVSGAAAFVLVERNEKLCAGSL